MVQMGVAVEGLWLGLAIRTLWQCHWCQQLKEIWICNQLTSITRFAEFFYCLIHRRPPYFASQIFFVLTIATCKCPLWAKAMVWDLILACWLAQYGYFMRLFTDHTQLTSSWCISLTFIKSNLQFYLPLSELLIVHPLQILLQFLLWCSADGCKLNILFCYVLMICGFVLTQQMLKRVG